MLRYVAAALSVLCALAALAAQAPDARAVARTAAQASPEAPQLPAVVPPRPRAGPVDVYPLADVRRGVKGIAWTVFEGSEPEPVPVELIGLWKNAWGPRQDVILAKLGGKALRTNVAGGMSGSPVYVDGKLLGAIALRISVFSPDAICGITPIQQMLEINAIDDSRPPQSKSPAEPQRRAELIPPASLLEGARMTPIETPLTFAGFHENTLREFRPWFEQMGITPVLGGAAGAIRNSAPAPGWKDSLQPGEAIAGVLVSGDLSVTGLGTVTYNDGRRVLGFGHSFFNLGPVNMPMSKGEVLMVLSSQFQPNKFANATEIVGSLRQDRHSGILGELGATAETIPVKLRVRSQPQPGSAQESREFHFNVFAHPRWTPFLMMLSVFNTLQDLNSAASDEATYRLSGAIRMDGQPELKVSTMTASGDAPMPAPMQIAAWWADRFNRLYQNPHDLPQVREVTAEITMDAERRVTAIESAWLDQSVVSPGGELTGRIVLKPWRGERQVKPFRLAVPNSIAKGEHRLLLSDGDTLSRTHMMAAVMNRNLDLGQTISLLNQERANNRLYLSLVEARPTIYVDDHAMSALPPSVIGVLQTPRGGRPLAATAETTRPVESMPVDAILSGSASLRFSVK
jgi:hypothetical protein